MSSLLDLKPDQFTFYESIQRSCRNCVNWFRVKESRTYRHALRGFCIFGSNDNRWELYMSTSYANKCPNFIFCPIKSKITEKEKELSMKFFDYRTEWLKDFNKKQKKSKDNWLHSWVSGQEAAAKQFRREHRTELIEINKSFDIKFKEYQKIMDSVKRFIFNSTQIVQPSKNLDIMEEISK